MAVRFHPHAQERMHERGATADEVTATVERGEKFPVKFGRMGFQGDLEIMKLSYDSRYNIAYISFQPKASNVESIKISDELIVDIAPDGTIYGMELLNANEQISPGEMDKIHVVNEATGEQIGVPLDQR